MTYVLKDVEVYTSRGSRVYHVAPHSCEAEPHTLCMSRSPRLERATQRQVEARTMCWRCQQVLEQRARDLQAARDQWGPPPSTRNVSDAARRIPQPSENFEKRNQS